MTKTSYSTLGNFQITITEKRPASDESRKAIQKFVDIFHELLYQLDSLLGLEKYLENNRRSVIGKRLASISAYASKGDGRWKVEYSSIKMMVDDLARVKDFDLAMFYRFRSTLRRQRTSSGWHGQRFELHAAAYLIINGAQITKRESPDFSAQHNGNVVFIEACSARVEGFKGKNHFYKLDSALNRKNKKKYANEDTALFIEVSNLLHHEEKVPGRENLQDAIKSRILSKTDIKYGAVVLFWFNVDLSTHRYESIYTRVTLGNCSEKLRGFLDDTFPMGHLVRVDPLIPEDS